MNTKISATLGRVALATLAAIVCGAQPVCGADAPAASQEPATLTASIGAKGSGGQPALFLFKRQEARTGAAVHVSREYTWPDGRPAERERLVYNGENLLSLDLEDLQTGAHGSVRIQPEPGNPARRTIHFEYTKDAASGAKPKTGEETLRPDTVTDDMLGSFLAARWDTLSKGKPLKFRLIYLPRRETIGFTFLRDSESKWHGRDVLIIRMEPTSFIISKLVDPSFFTVEKDGQHRVLQYVGRTVPKTKAGNKWSDLDADVVFDWK